MRVIMSESTFHGGHFELAGFFIKNIHLRAAGLSDGLDIRPDNRSAILAEFGCTGQAV